jgi:Uma2 family endonuclease
VLVPDLAGWRRERMPVLPEDHRFEVVPDWVCEVISPSTAGKDRARKLPVYARHGVAWAWLVDPLARTLEVFRLEGEHWLLTGTHSGDDRVAAPPFDAIELALPDLWVPSEEE